MIPKIIWTYWDKDEIPIYIQDCINTWKVNCKNNWSINILNKTTIKLFLEETIDYPQNIFTECPQHQSDMFGAALLNKYGGVWMDVNIIMTGSIDFILEKEWFGYYDEHDKNPEVFLYATHKNSTTIHKIHKLFFKIFAIDRFNRLKLLKESFGINDEYFYPQQLVQYIIENDPEVKKTIIDNSVNQWRSIYTLIVLLNKHYNIVSKSQILDILIAEERVMPQIFLNHPLIKLQGSGQQTAYRENKNSWWWRLTHSVNDVDV